MSEWALLIKRGGRFAALPLSNHDVIGSHCGCDVRLRGDGVESRHARVRTRDDKTLFEAIADAPLKVAKQTSGLLKAVAGDVLWLGGTPAVVARFQLRNGCTWLSIGGLGSASQRSWRSWFEIALAAPHRWPLLLLGESGTGKEVAARLCHARSSRSAGPFVAINCAALPHNLVEAELFGSVRGAYTGSTSERLGAFSRADGGTLLLDEIGELPVTVQAALLRVLENGEIQVVGGASRRVDVRVIAATNVDIGSACSASGFRLDLLHRLAVTTTTLPPLRERENDASLLLQEMLQARLPAGIGALVNGLRWPGNVRQLRNVARRARLFCPHGPVQRSHLMEALKVGDLSGHRTIEAPQKRLERVAEAVAREPTVGRAWRATGLPRSTFYRYLAKTRRQRRTDSALIGRNGASSKCVVFDAFSAAGSVETATTDAL